MQGTNNRRVRRTLNKKQPKEETSEPACNVDASSSPVKAVLEEKQQIEETSEEEQAEDNSDEEVPQATLKGNISPSKKLVEDTCEEEQQGQQEQQDDNSDEEVQKTTPKKRRSPAKIPVEDMCTAKTTKNKQCTKKGSLEHEGKKYCPIHSPVKEKSDAIMCQFKLKNNPKQDCSKKALYKIIDNEEEKFCCKIHLPENVVSEVIKQSSPSPVKTQSIICCGKKKNGENCGANSSIISEDGKIGYCRYHVDQKEKDVTFISKSPTKKTPSVKKTRALCQGMTKAKKNCRKYASEGSDYCLFHKK